MRRRCWLNSSLASRKRWRIARSGCPTLKRSSRPCKKRSMSLMTAWRRLRTANIAPAAVLLKLAESRSQPVHERLSIVVLQVNTGIVVEGAINVAWDAVAGASSQRGSLRFVEETFPTDEMLRDLLVCALQHLVVERHQGISKTAKTIADVDVTTELAPNFLPRIGFVSDASPPTVPETTTPYRLSMSTTNTCGPCPTKGSKKPDHEKCSVISPLLLLTNCWRPARWRSSTNSFGGRL